MGRSLLLTFEDEQQGLVAVEPDYRGFSLANGQGQRRPGYDSLDSRKPASRPPSAAAAGSTWGGMTHHRIDVCQASSGSISIRDGMPPTSTCFSAPGAPFSAARNSAASGAFAGSHLPV